MRYLYELFFFFQAEDGIRDVTVTGVQTCALPISEHLGIDPRAARRGAVEVLEEQAAGTLAHDEAGARRVERPGGARRVLVLRHEPAHGAEAGQDQGMDAR